MSAGEASDSAGMSIFSDLVSDVKFKVRPRKGAAFLALTRRQVSHIGVKAGAEDEAFEAQRHLFEKYEKHIKALVKSMEKLEKSFKGTRHSVVAQASLIFSCCRCWTLRIGHEHLSVCVRFPFAGLFSLALHLRRSGSMKTMMIVAPSTRSPRPPSKWV